MAYVTYDKAKWHWGAKNAPTDIPQENGATHIAFFFRWCMERKLYSKDFAADFADDIARMEIALITVSIFWAPWTAC